MPKISAKRQQEILRLVAGEWRVIELPADEADTIWTVLKDRKPFHTSNSTHVIEHRYRYQKKIYHVFWDINGGIEPSSVGIRENYDWDK
jgi:hypothetical protein